MFALPRFYPILDTETVSRHGMSMLEAARAILQGRARILQYRHKGAFSRQHFDDAQSISKLCNDAGAMFVMNDRADIAAILGAGLHLGQDDLLPSQARIVTGPNSSVGFSTHNETQLRAAADEPADYLALGPIFSTGSKMNPDPVVGVDELRRLRPLTARPLVAIGGITLSNAAQVFDAGADSIAVIGGLFTSIGLKQQTEEWMRATEGGL